MRAVQSDGTVRYRLWNAIEGVGRQAVLPTDLSAALGGFGCTGNRDQKEQLTVGAKLVKRPRPKAFELKHMEGFPSLSNILNKDPNRKYVLANRLLGPNPGGVEYYESVGYKVECKSKDGPRFAGFNSRDQKEGDVLERRELVLMSILKSSRDETEMTAELIEKYGPRGDTGLQRFDDLMAHISDNDPNSGFNPLRNTNLGNQPQHFYPISGNKLEEGLIAPKG